MKLATILFVIAIASANLGHADTASQIRATYLDFADAQNARDATRIRSHMTHDAEFLWVSAGQSFWGVDTVVARMSSFQKAKVWHVEPDLDASNIVSLGADSAILHMPLTLVIGKAESPDRLPFLVSIIFVKEGEWKIAALLTTEYRP